MGLRLSEGVPLDRLAALAGGDMALLPDPATVAALAEGGFLHDDPDRLRATAEGRQRLDAVIERLVP